MAGEGLLNTIITAYAGSFVIGVTYSVGVPGNTDYTLVGAADSNPGTVFVATGVGAGDGTATIPAAVPALQKIALSTSYETQPIVAKYIATIDGYIARGISTVVADDFIHLLDGRAPYISNGIYPGLGVDNDHTTDGAVFYTKLIEQHATNLFPDNQRFALYALIAMGHIETANKYINSAVNAKSLSDQTFTTQDALMTGNIMAVSTSVTKWGEEMVDTGVLFDFKKLDNIGTPQAIVEALMSANMLGVISDELTAQGLDVVPLSRAIRNNPDLVLKPPVQKRCYDAFKFVTGEKLTSILDVMKLVTPNIFSLDELLDLRKIFPTTFSTIIAPRTTGLQNIFTAGGHLTGHFTDIVTPLGGVLPDIITKSNSAFICSLKQINGILNTNSETLGTVAACVENHSGLPNTGNLTDALPADTENAIIGSFGGGTGPNGTFYLTDLIGAAAGLPFNSEMTILSSHIAGIEAVGGFDDIADNLQVMQDVNGGVDTARVTFDDGGGTGPWVITILPGNPGAGVYSDAVAYQYADALQPVITALDTTVDAYLVAQEIKHIPALAAYGVPLAGVRGGIKALWDANVRFTTTYVNGYQTDDVDLDGLPKSKSSTLLFAENLHQYGRKIDKQNIAEILEAMAINNRSGNAIIAAMREGRNIDKLESANIKSDALISEKPPIVEPGNIS